MNLDEAIQKYRELFPKEDFPGKLVALKGNNDIIVVRGVKLPEYTELQYFSPHLRFRNSGDIEKGTSFEEDAWEANSIYVDGKWEPFKG